MRFLIIQDISNLIFYYINFDFIFNEILQSQLQVFRT